MGVADIGTPGAPMDSPPLTAWQAAVRDALGSDTPVAQRFLALTGGTLAAALTVEGDVTAQWIASLYGADMGGYRITAVADPVDIKDAANKGYVNQMGEALQSYVIGAINQLNAWRQWVGTQAEYDAIVTKDPDVLYVVI